MKLQYVGTVRENRMGGSNLLDIKRMAKTHCAHVDYKSSDDIIDLKWYDNKCVSLFGNAADVHPMSAVLRYSKEETNKVPIVCPAIVSVYNANMGGGDLSDLLTHMYKTAMKSKRWYLPLCARSDSL
ncbi:UNVERIFIED_CONTAM: hypothetical protein FKN15_000502 [Acipenser sinensis]